MSSSVCRRLSGLFATAAKPTTTTTTTTTALTTTTRDETLLGLVAKFKKSSDSDRFRRNQKFYLKTVSRLALANKYSLVDEILQHQKQYPTITKEGFTAFLVTLYGKAGMFDHARKLFDEMPDLKCERTVMSFNALLSACVNSKRFETVGELLCELPDKLSIRPDTVSYNTVVKAFCKMGSFDSALAVLSEMEKSGVEPDLVTFNTLLDAFYKNDMFEEAEKAWGLMREKNFVPIGRTYNPKIRALVKGNRIPEAVEVFKEMGSKGVTPDLFTFTALIKGFCDEGNSEAAKIWYKEMRKNDCFPDSVTLEILVNCACKEGDFEFALGLCKEGSERRCYVGTMIGQRVVNGLVEVSKVEEAKELVELYNSISYFRKYKLEMPSE